MCEFDRSLSLSQRTIDRALPIMEARCQRTEERTRPHQLMGVGNLEAARHHLGGDVEPVRIEGSQIEAAKSNADETNAASGIEE